MVGAEPPRRAARAPASSCSAAAIAVAQQCVDLTRQIARMRGNLDRINVDLQRLRGGDSDRGEQRRSVMVALAQNNCGPQYRRPRARRAASSISCSAATRNEPSGDLANPVAQGGTRPHHLRAHLRRILFPDLLRDQCVALPRGREDLPAHVPGRRGDAVLLSDRRRGRRAGDLDQRRSPIRRCRTRSSIARQFDAACSCKRPGQSWADALGKDEAVEPGDVVVTEDRAKQLSAAAGAEGPAKGRAPAAAQPRGAAPRPDRRAGSARRRRLRDAPSTDGRHARRTRSARSARRFIAAARRSSESLRNRTPRSSRARTR